VCCPDVIIQQLLLTLQYLLCMPHQVMQAVNVHAIPQDGDSKQPAENPSENY
jgi:hypothetical protein